MVFNLFKKNKPKEEKKAEIIESSKPVTPNHSKLATGQASNQSPVTSGDASLILKGAHVTEKAGTLNALNQYVFKVVAQANKIEIKKAQEGQKAGFKKAIVKLAGGHKIDIMPK